jgi:hypothetical protein
LVGKENETKCYTTYGIMGKITIKETGIGVPNLVVTAYDVGVGSEIEGNFISLGSGIDV